MFVLNYSATHKTKHDSLFNSISTNTTRYGVVDKFENLYKIINGID